MSNAGEEEEKLRVATKLGMGQFLKLDPSQKF